MYSSQSAEHSLNLPCRRIAAVTGDTEYHRFLVGTCILPTSNNTSPNELHMLRFHEDLNELGTDLILEHPTGEVWELNPYPGDARLVLTCGRHGISNDGGSSTRSKTVLWKMPPPPDDDFMEDPTTSTVMEPRAAPLEESLHIPLADSDELHCSIWNNPEEEPMDLLTLTSSYGHNNDNALTLSRWDCEYGTPEEPIYQTILPFAYSSVTTSTSPKVCWDPHNVHLVAVSHGPNVSIYDLRTDPQTNNNGNLTVQTSSDLATKITSESGSSDDPAMMDTQTFTVGARKRRYHRYNVTGLDYNPNRPHIMVTGGEDALLKFWDLRTTSSSPNSMSYHTSPTTNYSSKSFYPPHLNKNKHNTNNLHTPYHRPIKMCRGGHSHWMTKVQYNPFHDQLILSAGTDSIVNLWRISSISSSPLLELNPSMNLASQQTQDDGEEDMYNTAGGGEDDDGDDDDDDKSINDGPDIRVTKTEHQECVYDLAWSKCDAWVWASVGLDGGVILSHVPSKEKYKILL